MWSARFILGLGLAARLLASNSAAERSYERALDLVTAGNAAAAEEEFRKAWEADPADTRYLHDLTVHYIHQHKFSEALALIRDSVKRSGPTALAWTLQGELLFEQKQYDAAYQSLRSALEISNEGYRAHELLGLILALHRRTTLALEELMIAARQNPNSAQVHFYCGRLFYQTGDYPAARSEFLQCLKLKPNYPQARENLGLAYEALGDVAAAAAEYQRAIELQKSGQTPPNELAHVCLAVLLQKQGQETAARSLLTEALVRNPNSAWANFEFGRLLFLAGEDPAAEQYLRRAVKFDSNYSRPHFFLGKLCQRNRRQAEAKAEFALFERLDKELENRQPQATR